MAGVAIVAGCAVTQGGHGNGHGSGPGADRTGASASPSASAPGTPAPTPSGMAAGNQDPSRFAKQVVKYADQAGIHPQLLMAILYNESYKPHDPAWERAWQRMKPDAAFGIANMHKAAFDETKRGRDFAGRGWQELPDDPSLAIEAAAWYLHDLARDLPDARSGTYTRDELLALGYNAGPGNMAAFARGAHLGPAAQSYLDRLRGYWSLAGQVVRRHG
ncbi:hypothetical protein SCATT_p08310 (plasmid) [Streptantibioticus cattleyicolor NRRL 8057 = DSM 46488]|uniref:Transglycosylase SLT domain-containing protein n=1 Tax=Streptantibioticus cattleyicolor (strain ATCC 35852 / DSM 46488 / JCM 4925 / NBRC 14057 / NRRL 8057) TaxID=1003195 RepID=F8JNK9_STREN|nr:hypothetical protein SCATT_p08310 [Streptantibioticus cattleyicolor NRRL 8057 = DSM 46488]CCB71929.1 protein of unknown function [Streptantibioticus cattleyicolor NRRL 8057 = DSM 46488]